MTLFNQSRVTRNPLLHIIKYYFILIRARGFQLDFIAEGDVGELDVNWFFLAIYFDGHDDQKFQLTIPDIDLAQHNPFYHLRANEDEVVTVVSMVCYVGKRQALETLVPIVYRVADLQRPEHANVSLTLHIGATMKNSILISTHYYVLLHISTHYYYHEASQQACHVHQAQHGVYVQMTTIQRHYNDLLQ